MFGPRCVRKCLGRRFQSTKPLILFIPNENMYTFEGERLTPEQNKEAIPQRPRFDSLPKVYHEMLSPEYIADLVVRPAFNDVLITALAKDSPFCGNTRYKVVPKDSQSSPNNVNLLFSEVSRKYIEVFNNQITKLKPFPQDHMLPTLSNAVSKNIEHEITNYKQKNGIESIFSQDTLSDIAESLNLFENSRKVSTGEVDTSHNLSMITLEDFCIYNVKQIHQTAAEEFSVFLDFIKQHISLFTVNGIRRLLETLLSQNLWNLDNNKILDQCNSFIIHEIFANYSNMVYQLSPAYLDKMAGLLATGENLEYSKRILKTFIEARKFAPSEATVQLYLQRCSGKATTPEQFIRDAHILKPVFFMNPISLEVGQMILTNGIRNVVELENFVRLLSNDMNSDTLKQLGDVIIKRMVNILEDVPESNSTKTIKLVQVIKALTAKECKLNDDTKSQLENTFKSLSQEENAEMVREI